MERRGVSCVVHEAVSLDSLRAARAQLAERVLSGALTADESKEAAYLLTAMKALSRDIADNPRETWQCQPVCVSGPLGSRTVPLYRRLVVCKPSNKSHGAGRFYAKRELDQQHRSRSHALPTVPARQKEDCPVVLSLQGLASQARQVAATHSHDFDLKNIHPVICSQLADVYSVDSGPLPNLMKCINCRDNQQQVIQSP